MVTETNTREVAPDVTVFEIAGRLSLGNTLVSVERAIQALIAGGVRKLVIDLTSLRAIDSSGLGTLLACNGVMGNAGGELRVAGACGHVAESFKLVHLDAIMTLDPNLQTSLNQFALPHSAAATS